METFDPSGFIDSVMRSREQLDIRESLTLFDFSRERDITPWRPVNDTVIGGLSTGSLYKVANNSAVFGGIISLSNGGGFASVRAPMPSADLSGFHGLLLRVVADDRLYTAILMDELRFDGTQHQAPFTASGNGWTEIFLRFTAFKPTHRGSVLPDHAPLRTDALVTIGLQVIDRRAGRFGLGIQSISAVTTA